MKPEKYFRTVCWVELEETLTILGCAFARLVCDSSTLRARASRLTLRVRHNATRAVSYDNAMKIFEAFIEIDAE